MGHPTRERRRLQTVRHREVNVSRAEDVEFAYGSPQKGSCSRSNPWPWGFIAYGRSDVTFAGEQSQAWLLPTIRAEYDRRNCFTRLLAAQCMQRHRLGSAGTGATTFPVTKGPAAMFESIAKLALSAFDNVRYHKGLSEELGGFMSDIAGP